MPPINGHRQTAPVGPFSAKLRHSVRYSIVSSASASNVGGGIERHCVQSSVYSDRRLRVISEILGMLSAQLLSREIVNGSM
jgi:hypothetical protein